MEDRITVPEDLSELNDEALVELGQSIQEAAAGIDPESSEDSLTEVERLVAEFDRVNDELTAREQLAAERAERGKVALERLGLVDDETAGDDAGEELEVEDVADAATTDDAETLEVEAEVVEELAAEDIEIEAPEAEVLVPEIVEAAAAKTRRQVVSSLKRSRPIYAEPRKAEPRGAAMMAAQSMGAISEGQALDAAALAQAITKKRHGIGNVPSGTFEKVTMGSSVAEFGTTLGGGAEENFSSLAKVVGDHAAARAARTAVVASGGNCAPLEANYDFFRLAESMSPVEDCLPVVQAPRGGIRYIQPTDFRDAAGGVRVTTEAEDAAGYPPTAPKPCVAVVCPPEQECRVDAVSQCVRFGNLNHRVFPEQVESFLEDLAVIFTETKEIFYLDAIEAGSTAVTTPAGPYGAVRTLADQILRAAANYRRRNHMDPDAVLQLMLPSWVVEFLKVDAINDNSLGLSWLDADMDAIATFFAQANLDVCYYYDSATGAGQAFNEAQAAGPLNAWPTSVVSYLFAPGTFVRLDGGTLDVGLIRDSSLNGTNDLEIFSEQWVQVCQVGLESLRIEHDLCPNGAAPDYVLPFTC